MCLVQRLEEAMMKGANLFEFKPDRLNLTKGVGVAVIVEMP